MRASRLLVLVGLLVSTTALAEPQPTRNQGRVDLGLGSAVGFLGGVYERTVAPNFLVEAGLGLGLTGVQLSIMPKAALPVGDGRFTLGAGLALGIPLIGGIQSEHDAAGDPVPSSQVLPWLNADLGYEHHLGDGWVIALAAGVAMPLDSFHYDVSDIGDTIKPFTPFPQARIGVGRSF